MFKHLANLSGFSLERLASLCEVAEAGSIGEASRGDPNRQSQLSRQVAELEGVFEVKLLARQTRPYRLTAEGKELAQAARQFFQSVDDFQRRAADKEQRVVMGAGETLIQWLLFPACEEIRKHSGKVVFAFKNLDSGRLVDGLQRGQLDLALIRKEEVTPGLVNAGNWRYVQAAFVPKNLSLATGELDVADLGRLPWALLEGQGHFRQFLETVAREQGVALNCLLECSSYTQVALAVQTGKYAGFLPEFAAATGAQVLQRKVAKRLRYERSLTLAWQEATARTRPVVKEIASKLTQELNRRFEIMRK